MRLKHNKKRNTAFVYEVLIRELTESVVKNKKNKQNTITSIIKEHFGNNSALNQELNLYKSIYETRDIDKRLAEKIVVEVKQKYSDLDKGIVFKEQSALINKINKTLSNRVFNNFVPNYKSIASVYSIFQDKLPIKDRVLLEENIINQMSSSVESLQRESQVPMDSIIYSTFVKKFNEEYTDVLLEEQKQLLNKYILSFVDNGVEFKIFLNEEIGRLKENLALSKDNPTMVGNEDLQEKIELVQNLLGEAQEKEIDIALVELVIKTQALLREIS